MNHIFIENPLQEGRVERVRHGQFTPVAASHKRTSEGRPARNKLNKNSPLFVPPVRRGVIMLDSSFSMARGIYTRHGFSYD